MKQYDVIAHPCHNFYGGSIKPPLELGHWRGITPKQWILLVTPCLLTRIREFIHTQHRNTTRGRRLSVDKFPYPRKQTRGNEFIPCSNNICDILKRFRSFKIPAITLIWPKSPYKHSVTRSYRSSKESGRRSESPL